ncbi:MAG: hypothetical protein CFE30_00835 [Bradyrhizobium sp. PARBB1]|jgi:hypothetical protein|nr:MAG: hypothetical protein CFE30_00835 [Bradyrhizobium sp. PARBB1]
MDNRLPDVTVAAQNINTGQAVVFIVPLNGFAAALERTIQLGSRRARCEAASGVRSATSRRNSEGGLHRPA